jgi:hypothetical protein
LVVGGNKIDFALMKNKKPAPNTPMKEEIFGGEKCPTGGKSFLPHTGKKVLSP